MMDKISIRKKQIEEATAMINLNSDLQLDWKFLIYDHIGENIIAPLFNIEDLENLNVTSHLPLHRVRDQVPDVSAVYFVLPTDENIKRICLDLSSHLYDSYYLNFISPISRAKLEKIAETALLADSAMSVKKVYDQHLNFIALEDDFFILREKDKHMISYHAINRATDAEDAAIVVDQIVEGLFSMLVALNMIPIIRCPKGGAAQLVANKLSERISETLRDSRNNLFAYRDSKSGSSSALSLSIHRPLLCIVDRTLDMSTPLHHTWTYQALIHDLLNTELNKVSITDESGKAKSKVQTFDLNPSDKFWREQKGSPFPQVADAVQRELDEYKRRENEVKSPIDLNPLGSGPGSDESAMLAESTAKLTNTMSSLQELLENKRVIGNHTTIAHSVLDEIKKRKLDNYFEIEEKIMNRNLVDRATLDEIIMNPDYGQPSDKYRLFLIAYIHNNPSLSEDEAEKYVNILEGVGCRRSAFDYIKRWKTFSKINSSANIQTSSQTGGGVLRTAGMFSKLMSQGSQFVMEGVKNLVLKEHHLPLTKIVDGLVDTASKISQESMDYAYIDPKAPNDDKIQRRKTFQDSIVFVVGGGNYIEYQNLVDYCKSKTRGATSSFGLRNVIYGSTDLMNAGQFLQQLEQLGEVS